MSFLDKGDKNQTSSSSTQYPEWVNKSQEGLYGTTVEMTTPFMNTGDGYQPVAGWNTQQARALDTINRTNNVSRENRAQTVTAGMPSWMNGQAVTGTAQNVNGGMIQQLMNPFTESVINSTLGTMGRQNDQALNGIRARQAASGSFGGSRGAVAERLQNEGFADQVGSMAANLNLQGWNNASGLAQFNVGQNNAMTSQNLSAQNSMNALNTQGQNAMQVSNADRQLTAASLNDAFRTSEMNRDLAGANALLNAGGQKRSVTQSERDVPWQMLQYLGNATPKVYGQTTTTTSPDNSPGTLQQMLGLGLTVAGLPTGTGSSVGGDFLKKWF